ncbi:MAG TPA: ornithine carbamoyltransferase [Planctomycetota bacterium]|nr:ornithine carbamoyltransferase [Planctomycetota bacterium]
MSAAKRDLLTLFDLGEANLRALMPAAAMLKRERQRGEAWQRLRGRVLGMIFEKASTRTRVSFEVGMYELGGHAVYLAPQGSHIGRGEPVRDTARVLGGYCHAILIRTFGQERLRELAAYSPVPVVNGLTDEHHPCQVLADLFTVWERFGPSALGPPGQGGARFAWVGDGNNMAHSWIQAAALLGLDLTLACPTGDLPSAEILAHARAHGRKEARIEIVHAPDEAVRGRTVVSTDVWASMGAEEEAQARAQAFAGYRLDERLLAQADPTAIVLHCLPAHRGEEITESVLEGPRSAVFQQAENRLHAQKAALLWVFGLPLSL